ncbi:hypothetical protein LXA43DRAFT_1097365 [Ganoderma leucocontextum]|nr:hypothetical protein LXA43DRAFT_1097365 [Ganoderma leucocontextum]
MFALFLIFASSLSVTAFPLETAMGLVRIEERQESGAEGHLSHTWVVAVAVSLVVIIIAVTVTVLIVKLRQRRKRSPSRRRRNYARTSDELVAAPEQPHHHIWRGPYASRASYNRSPSPPSPVHLSEKDKWAQHQR